MNTNATTPKFSVGQVVKFAEPQDADEDRARYTVLEYRGARPEIGDTAPDRVLVAFICSMPYPPTYVFLADELEAA